MKWKINEAMKREIKFKRVYQHDEMGLITMRIWGNVDYRDNSCLDFSSFKSPSQIHRYYPIDDLQYTGIKDITGKEVYEGDIITYESKGLGFKGYIVSNGWEFYYKPIGKFSKDYDHMSYPPGQNIKIIGNIYENPELLKL